MAIVIRALFFLAFWFSSTLVFATECGDALRGHDYRHLPSDGQAKVPMVDYKLINQLLLSLQRAVSQGHDLPDGFSVGLTAAQAPNPVGGVILSGRVNWPEHDLFHHDIELEVRRERLAILVEVRDLSDHRVFETALSEEEYREFFPFQQNHGMLLSLAEGLRVNFQKFHRIK